MIDDQDERLLQDELDGVASPEGSKRLRERLAQSAEVRARQRELETVARALDQVRMEETPVDLKEGVLAVIAAAERPGPARTGWLENPGGASRGRPVLAWAYPFLAGAVAGGLLIAVATGNGLIVAGDNDGDMFTSRNGTNWTTSSAGLISRPVRWRSGGWSMPAGCATGMRRPRRNLNW